MNQTIQTYREKLDAILARMHEKYPKTYNEARVSFHEFEYKVRQELDAAPCIIEQWDETPLEPLHEYIPRFLEEAFRHHIAGDAYMMKEMPECRCWFGTWTDDKEIEENGGWGTILADRFYAHLHPSRVSGYTSIEDWLKTCSWVQENIDTEEDVPLDPETNIDFALFLRFLCEYAQEKGE